MPVLYEIRYPSWNVVAINSAASCQENKSKFASKARNLLVKWEVDIQICHICQPGKGWGQLSCDVICRNETVREKWVIIQETLDYLL